MHLKYAIPLKLFVYGPTAESLTAQTSFSYRGCLVTVTILGETGEANNPPSSDHRYYLDGESLQLVMVEETNRDILTNLISASDYTGLLTLLRKAVNQCLNAIRYFGMAPLVHELPSMDDDHTGELLQGWGVEISDDGVQWKRLLQTEETETHNDLLGYLISTVEVGELDARKWAEIEEAIQDKSTPPPEQEFMINAFEHIRSKNFRYALLEATIGLEIVFERFLKTYLRVQKGIPDDRIKEFVKSDLTLSMRLNGLLDLTLSLDDIQEINLKQVRTAVNWRNSIMHRTGYIPPGFKDSYKNDVIIEVLNLTQMLAFHDQHINAAPAMQAISADIRKRYRDLPPPTIDALKNHHVLVTFKHALPMFKRKIPSSNRLEAVVSDISTKLRDRDPRFIPDQHLTVLFFFGPPENVQAVWSVGSLEFKTEESGKS